MQGGGAEEAERWGINQVAYMPRCPTHNSPSGLLFYDFYIKSFRCFLQVVGEANISNQLKMFQICVSTL